MRRFATALGLVVLVAALTGLSAGSASAGGTKKLVEGTVYDTTCAGACAPECPPPPCGGPVTQGAKGKVVCAQQRIVACPLYGGSARVCLPSSNCAGFPVYSGEGAVVKVRKRGSATVLATLPVVEGHFEIRLAPGQYILHPRLAEEQCWTGEPWMVTVLPRQQGPIPVSLGVSNHCVLHLDAAR